MGGREVGEFGVDSALSTPSGSGSGRKSRKGKKGGAGNAVDEDGASASAVGLGAHGIRVGDVVKVEEIGAGGRSDKTAKGKESNEEGRGGVEGVVTRVGERSVWVACSDRGGTGKPDHDHGVQELWGKKVWM